MQASILPDTTADLADKVRQSRRLTYVALGFSLFAFTASLGVLLAVGLWVTDLTKTMFASSIVLCDRTTENSLIVIDEKLQEGTIRVRDQTGTWQDVRVFPVP